MKMTELIRYEIPPEMIQLWRREESEVLLPLQEAAVKKHNLFTGGNLLIQAPTSSGKTFIGEMAAVHTALRRKKVVYLVPLKALAEEKYLDFREKYAGYGVQVIISTRDHRQFDQQLEDGNFAIAVVVYEKLSQLLVRRPERIEEIELIIADELELLSDPDRGAMVELLLTRILLSRCRLIGLSAVIGEADKLAEWMRAELVCHERRPVELRYGVLHEGVFRYRTYNDYGEGEEALVNAFSDSSWEILTANLCAFLDGGEPCLVFVKAKHEARQGAELLARRITTQPRAAQALDELRSLEPTRSRESLLNTLNSGVAFHNADLSPEERRVVEKAFREGEVKVLVSTSTLSVGLNLPAQNVFISADKWRYDSRFGMPWKTPIRHAEYENMGGRAGRYGSGRAFGRAILIAPTPFDQETLWRRYIEGERERIEPRLAHDSLENHVLRLVASHFCRTEEELQTFLESTLTGRWVWLQSLTLDECAFRVRAAVNRAVDAGVLIKDGAGRLEATPLGAAVAAKGISITTAHELEQWIRESETRDWADIDLILAAALTPDGRMLQVMLTAREYEHADYPGQLKQRTRDLDLSANVPLNRFRNCSLMPFFEEVRAIKVALFILDWIDEAAVYDVEERYHTMGGQILSAADQLGWLIDAASAIATALGAESPFIERIRTLSERVQRGLREETAPLARLAGPGTPRPVLAALVAHRLNSVESLAQAPVELLSKWMTPAEAKALQQRAAGAVGRSPLPVPEGGAPPPSSIPALIIDDRRPHSIVVDGVPVRLQDKQYRLIRTLAAFPSECVPYETIYQTLWGDDVIVESAQMHFQKRKLLAAIGAAAPHRKELVTTVPKRGFMLNLSAADVSLLPVAVFSAA